jgi:hypothetical protein
MHQFPLANRRNQPLDQVRYHPLRNPDMSSRRVDRGNPVCYLLPVIGSTLAELSSVFGKNCRRVSLLRLVALVPVGMGK